MDMQRIQLPACPPVTGGVQGLLGAWEVNGTWEGSGRQVCNGYGRNDVEVGSGKPHVASMDAKPMPTVKGSPINFRFRRYWPLHIWPQELHCSPKGVDSWTLI